MTILEVPYIRLATVVKVIDGDTIDFDVDLGFYRNRTEIRVRLIAVSGGVDAYELSDKDPRARSLAIAGRDYVRHVCPIGSTVRIETIQYKHDGFKRYLARVETETIPDLGSELISAGLAVPWLGDARPAVDREQTAIRRALESYRLSLSRRAAR